MNVSVELSMYPLRDAFLDDIKAFIDRLSRYEGIRVRTNSMSTRVFGDYDRVMEVLKEEISRASEKNKHVVFVMKLIPLDLDTD